MAKLKESFLSILINFIIIGNDVAFSERYDKREEATMIFTGDMTFDGPVKYFAEVKGTCDYKRPFDRIREEMQGADLRVGNLESPLINSAMEAKKLLPNKNIHQRGLPKAADGLKYAGFDVVQLANNHMADYGNSGMKSTIKALKHYGIDYVGVTDKFDTAGKQKGFVRTINGVRIGMLAYCWNYDGCRAPKCGPNDPCDGNHKMLETGPTVFIKTVALKEISKMKRRVDILVVLMHWGKEVTVIPAMSTRLIAHEIKLAGANLIIGSHPHVIQGHECLGKSTLSVYSLGNFLFPKQGSITKQFLAGRHVREKDVEEYLKKMTEIFNLSQQAYIVRIKVNRRSILSAQYLPIEIKNENTTNCLQPVPRGKWLNICASGDIYCYDFRNFYANSSMLHGEQLRLTDEKRKPICIGN